MPNKVYVTSGKIDEKAIQLLEDVAKVKVSSAENSTKETLQSEVAEVDGLLTILTDRIDAELFSKAKRLRVVANMAAGYDNIDVNEATKREIMITNTPDVLTETVADTTMALLLSVARRITEGDRYVRSGKWSTLWSPTLMVGRDVHGKTLGIYGLGRIGSALAKRAKGLDMRIIYYSRHRKPELEKKLDVSYTDLDDLLAESDYLSIHLPLTRETRHAIGAQQLRLMKRTSYLINISRGPVVDEKSLIEALLKKRIAGAALDVFEEEPINPKNPLMKLENVVLTPHIGSATWETRRAMAVKAAENIVAALNGKMPPNLVNLELVKHR